MLGLRFGLRVDRIEIDRGQHQCGETAFDHNRVNRFPGIGKQHIRAETPQSLCQHLIVKPFKHKHTSLLYLDEINNLFFLVPGSDSQRQDNFMIFIAQVYMP